MSRAVIEAVRKIAPTLPPASRRMVALILKDGDPSPTDIMFLKTLLGATWSDRPTSVTPTKKPLRKFQEVGVRFIDARGGRALIADEAGVGKTAQAIGYLTLKRALPALVVCPSSVKVKWYRDILDFSDLRPFLIVPKTQLPSFTRHKFQCGLEPEPGFDVYIATYSMFRAKYDKAARKLVEASINGRTISEYRFVKQFVFDEIHRIKDPEAQSTKAATAVSLGVPSIGMTGTPVKNRVRDLWTQVRVVDPTIFPKFFDYALRYCGAKRVQVTRSKKVWDFSGSSNLEELNQKLKATVMLRRTKEEVLPELPKLTRVTIPVVLDKADEKGYEQRVKESREKLLAFKRERVKWKSDMAALGNGEQEKSLSSHAGKSAAASKLRGEAISKIASIQMAAALGKVSEAVDDVVGTVEGDGRVVVFAVHLEVIDVLVERLKKARLRVSSIDGRVTGMARQQRIDSFQRGEIDALVCGIQAIQEGVDLTSGNTVLFVEFGWNPADQDQAEGRINRFGQQRAMVARYLVAVGTIEERVVKAIDAKREVVNAAMGEGYRTISEDGILDALVDEVLKGEK